MSCTNVLIVLLVIMQFGEAGLIYWLWKLTKEIKRAENDALHAR